ncbi:hypothetical protein C8J57DRAFT_1283378 [Mycena rebaudengoi]|nr:hypothetical protein C8J57DRAFT_1283378 [Mycena rebaudengoi]
MTMPGAALQTPKFSTTSILTSTPMQNSLASLTCATPLSPSAANDPSERWRGSGIITPELLAVGELVAAMKQVLGALGTTFDSLGDQTDRVASLGPGLKVSGQLKQLRSEIALQVQEQEKRTEEVKHALAEAVKQALSEELKAHIYSAVESQVTSKVAHQLNTQVPESIRQLIKSHKRQILEVQTSLHNSEARQHNSALGPAALSHELRPLLRPLPDAEQPIHPLQPQATASPLFPRDLKALFSLETDTARTLVKEYGLENTSPSSPVADETVADDGSDARARNINKFMAHIGVVGFQTHAFRACTSSSPEEKSLLSPLIISVHPGI